LFAAEPTHRQAGSQERTTSKRPGRGDPGDGDECRRPTREATATVRPPEGAPRQREPRIKVYPRNPPRERLPVASCPESHAFYSSLRKDGRFSRRASRRPGIPLEGLLVASEAGRVGRASSCPPASPDSRQPRVCLHAQRSVACERDPLRAFWRCPIRRRGWRRGRVDRALLLRPIRSTRLLSASARALWPQGQV
jgi:hypothetical protein